MSDTREAFWSGFSVWVVIVLLTFLIACGVRTSRGRDINNHPTPIPQGVTQLGGRYYLFDSHAAVLPQDFCKGVANTGDQPVNQTTRVAQLPGSLFVVCDEQQTFGDHRALGKGFFAHIVPVARDPVIDGGLGIGLLSLLTPFGVAWSRERRSLRRRTGEAMVDADAKRGELAKAYARDEIDDTELERGLERVNAALLKEGVVEKKPHVPKVLRDL